MHSAAPRSAMVTATSNAAARLSRAIPDAALGGVGALFGAICWWFPFTRDQAVFYYMGREWIEHGRIPYRDTAEQKTPFIFLVNGLLARIFGYSAAPMHVTEWLIVAAVGVMAVRLVTPPRTSPRPGTYGAAILVANVFFFGFFRFRETCNCETWVVFFCAASMLAARSIRPPLRAAIISGLLAGLAIQAKPPAALLVPLPVYELLVLAWGAQEGRLRRASAALGTFAVGLLGINLLVLGYFGAHGALPAMIDIVVKMNAYNSTHVVHPPTLGKWYGAMQQGFGRFQPYSTILVVTLCLGVGVSLLRGARARAARYVWLGVVLLLAYGVMLSQLKLLLYQFETLLLPVALVGAVLYQELDAAAASPRSRMAVAPTFAAATLGFFLLSDAPKDEYLDELQRVGKHILYWTSDRDLIDSFSYGDLDLTESKQTGDWIAEHSGPDDALLVRGYECQIYFYAHRRYTGRFEHSLFQTYPWLAWRRDYYLEEDYRDIVAHRPRFVVAYGQSEFEVITTGWFTARGYTKRASFGRFDILELIDPGALGGPA
jgi:hypothetical protein